MRRAQKSTQALKHTECNPLSEKHTDSDKEDSGPMALSTAARKWFSKNSPEGFLRIVDAPPHEEPEKVAPNIDLAKITEGTIEALTGLPTWGSNRWRSHPLIY